MEKEKITRADKCEKERVVWEKKGYFGDFKIEGGEPTYNEIVVVKRVGGSKYRGMNLFSGRPDVVKEEIGSMILALQAIKDQIN